MAYQIDFTASNYASRTRRKIGLRLLLLAALGGVAYGVYDVYTTYNQPTLNEKLRDYEAVARPIEEMNDAWDKAANEYNAMMRYYRLVWADNPTNFLNAMASVDAPHLRSGFHPLEWTLKTGGECTLKYRFVFDPMGDKAGQVKGIEAEVVNSITSVVRIATNTTVAVEGVKLENLLLVKELPISVNFTLQDARLFPEKAAALTNCVKEIAAMRTKVLSEKVLDGNEFGNISTAQEIMMKYLDSGYIKDTPDLIVTNAINVSGWFDRADQFIARAEGKIGDAAERQSLREAWNRVGNARYPWQRFKALDNAEIVNRTKYLSEVSDGVKRFRPFLEQRQADCKKRLEPFVKSYGHIDVGNNPLIESDLKDRFAKEAGILRVQVPPAEDDPDAKPVILVKDDERFTFKWVRWKLLIGDTVVMEARGNEKPGAGSDESITLAKLADCVRRILKQPGPGYVLDTITITFNEENGNVSGAVVQGLLPSKEKLESKKEGEPTKEAKVNGN